MVSLFVEAACELGEGPVWDSVRQCLWWVDITNCTIYRADHAGHRFGQHVRSWVVDELIGFIRPHPDGTLWAGLQSGIHRVTLTADGEISVDRLTQLEATPPHRVRFNDATIDSEGVLYATTMDMDVEEPIGQLHRYADFSQQHADVLLGGFVIANGPAISPDGQTLYVNETEGHSSRTKGVYKASLSEQGQLGPLELFIDWQYEGSPDGVTVDPAGNLWIGGYGSRHLYQFTPAGDLRQTIAIPAWNITKAAVGPDAHTIFVTSARQGLSDEQLAEFPLTGSVWKIEV